LNGIRNSPNQLLPTGYEGATVRDIYAAAGAPFGSFTNHFGTKEVFVKEVLDRFFANLQKDVRAALEDKAISPCQRLKLRSCETNAGGADRQTNSLNVGKYQPHCPCFQSFFIRHPLQSLFGC
jgi:TetR/AcrR family transcriptional repressor of nem operon